MTTKKTRKKKKTPGPAAWVKQELAAWEVMEEEPPTPQAHYRPLGRKYSQIGVFWRLPKVGPIHLPDQLPEDLL